MPDQLITLPYGLPGTIYRSPLPYSPLFDPEHCLVEKFLAAQVEVVVMLTSEGEAQALTGIDLLARYQAHGLTVIYAPVEDFSVPEKGAFHSIVREVIQAAQVEKTIVIHCHAGLGRTGMLAACLAKEIFNLDGDQAIAWVRQFVPGAVENMLQSRFVREYKLPQM